MPDMQDTKNQDCRFPPLWFGAMVTRGGIVNTRHWALPTWG